MNYNLLEEKWIPVLWKDGHVNRVGIVEALTQAGSIRQIAASNPMDRVAILRFLLALLYWCQGSPPDELLNGSFPRNCFKKLDDNKNCFNLLGEGKRFYQDCDAERPQAVTHLIQEIPAGNNFWHFRHSTDRSVGLCPGCCAIGLLRLPLFSVSGLSGPKEPNLMAGINGVPPIYVVPWGKSLKETLFANRFFCSNPGEPSWSANGPTQGESEDIPLLAGLTLLSRRVWLHEPDGQAGICIGCGSHEALIRTVEFQTAGKQENDKWNDPHVVYVKGTKRKALRAGDLTRAGKFRMDRPWPDLLARILETNRPASLLVVGFATNKAKNIDVWELIIDTSPVGKTTQTSATKITIWKEDKSEDRLRKIIRGTRKPIKNDTRAATSTFASIRPHVEAEVAAKLSELIAEGDDAWERAAGEYSPMMAAVAKSLSPGFTSAVVERRREIAGMKPRMQPEANEAKKPSCTKGGGK